MIQKIFNKPTETPIINHQNKDRTLITIHTVQMTTGHRSNKNNKSSTKSIKVAKTTTTPKINQSKRKTLFQMILNKLKNGSKPEKETIPDLKKKYSNNPTKITNKKNSLKSNKCPNFNIKSEKN